MAKWIEEEEGRVNGERRGEDGGAAVGVERRRDRVEARAIPVTSGERGGRQYEIRRRDVAGIR